MFSPAVPAAWRRTGEPLRLLGDFRADGDWPLHRHRPRQPGEKADRAFHLPDFGLSPLHRARQADRRHGADRGRRLQTVFESAAPRAHPYRHRGGDRDACARPRPGGAHPRSLRQHRGGRNSRRRPRRRSARVTFAHLPVLEVVVPLLAAPVAVLLRRAAPAWIIATAACVFSFFAAVILALEVAAAGPVSYHLGSWPPPWGIEYRVDVLSAFVGVLVSGVAAVVAPYAWRSVAAELPRDQLYLFYALYCLCVSGLLGMTITGDAFNLFVFMEIASLSSYVLIALGRHRRALLAAYQYLILGTIGATFFVIGVGLLYLVTGTLNIADIAGRVAQISGTRPVLAALAFITVG